MHRWTLEGKRQKLAELERFRAKLLDNIESLEAELAREQETADRSPVTSISLPAFIKATLDRRRKIEGSVAEVDRSIAAAREEISLAFQESKKYETAHGNPLRRAPRTPPPPEQVGTNHPGPQPPPPP